MPQTIQQTQQTYVCVGANEYAVNNVATVFYDPQMSWRRSNCVVSCVNGHFLSVYGPSWLHVYCSLWRMLHLPNSRLLCAVGCSGVDVSITMLAAQRRHLDFMLVNIAYWHLTHPYMISLTFIEIERPKVRQTFKCSTKRWISLAMFSRRFLFVH